jgi:hypothetical protein
LLSATNAGDQHLPPHPCNVQDQLETNMIRKFLTAAAFLAIPLAAWASCTYYTINDGGKIRYCQECCYGSGYARQCFVTCN